MIWNEPELDKVFSNYGLKDEATSSVSSEKSSEVSDVSDDWEGVFG